MHRHLGDISIGDPRFTAHYEDQAGGLAQFVRDAIHASRQGRLGLRRPRLAPAWSRR